MIEKLLLKKFTVFDDFEIDFGGGINVLLGKNGTGKTHLLKAAYAMCSGNNNYVDQGLKVSNELIASELTDKLIKIFLPLEDRLGKLRSHGVGTDGSAELEAHFEPGGRQLRVSFHTNSQTVAVQEDVEYERYSWKPAFIPTKEVLSFMKGFASLYQLRELSFDQTYQDLIVALELPELRPEHLQGKAKWTMDEIEKICGGKFIFHGSGKVTFKSADGELSVNVMAEGFRKIGIVSRMLETGVIRPGVSGPLFWDEPEANLNPTMSRWLVAALLELSRNGQQVILATHDYFVLKWFELLMNSSEGDHVRYHALYRDETTNQIAINSTEDYSSIKPNAIEDTFEAIINADLDRSMGELGK